MENSDHTPSAKRFGSISTPQNGKSPFNSTGPVATASPTTGAGGAFGLGSGAFASFGSASKTPKTPGTAFDFGKRETGTPASEKREEDSQRRPAASRKSTATLRQPSLSAVLDAPAKEDDSQWPLKYTWIMHYRPPTSKNSDYEKSTKPLCRIHTAQAFWTVYSHLKRPSALPTVSDYHFFREGIRPVWEDEENKRGGKWIMRLKKGVADRYWEDLLLALVGDQFAEAGEEVCGAVVSVRSGEDVFSIWTKNDGGRNVKIRETIKRVLSLPADTVLAWKSHDDSITQRTQIDAQRQEKGGQGRRNTLAAKEEEKS